MEEISLIGVTGLYRKSSIKSIDLTGCPNLKTLEIQYLIEPMGGGTTTQLSKITNLNLSKNKQLHTLRISGSNINNFDFSQNRNLSTLIFFQMYQLESLDLSSNSQFSGLYLAQSPKIKSICVNKYINLGKIDLSGLEGSQDVEVKICEP